MEKKQRIEWIDISKAIGIILVVLGHVTQNKILFNIIYSFHMPMFFIISGYTYCYENKTNYFKKNAKSLMIPFYIFGLLSYVYWFFIERNFRGQDISPLKPLINFIFFYGGNEYFIENVALWFLPCLFLVKSIIYFFDIKVFNNTKNKTNTYIPIIIFAIISWYIYIEKEYSFAFMIERLGVYILFFMLGILINNNRYFGKEKLNYRLIFNFIIFISFTLLRIKCDNVFFNLISYFSLAISGSLLIFDFSQKNNFKWLKYIGKNTLLILCLHEPIKRVLIKVVSLTFDVSDIIIRGSFLSSNLITVLIIIIFIPIITIVNRYFPFLLGKARRRENEK